MTNMTWRYDLTLGKGDAFVRHLSRSLSENNPWGLELPIKKLAAAAASSVSFPLHQ